MFRLHCKYVSVMVNVKAKQRNGMQKYVFVLAVVFSGVLAQNQKFKALKSAILLYLKYRNQEKQRMSSQVADNSIANFIQKSFQILENKEYQTIIHWMANGRQFAIKQIEEFQDHILPKYFRHRNINSFIRQLNMYGFHKSRKDPSKNIFSHPYFLRGQPHILHLVRRKIKNQDKAQEENKIPILQTPQPKKKIQHLEPSTDIQSKKSFQSLSTIKDSAPIKTEKEVIPTKSEIQQAPTFSMISLGSFGLKFNTVDVSPFKGMMQKSQIMDSNPELYLKMREHHSIGQCDMMIDDDDDNISINDEIQRQRREFQNRRSGVTILHTSNLLQDIDFQ